MYTRAQKKMKKLYKKAELLKKKLAEVNAETEEAEKEAAAKTFDEEDCEPQSVRYSPPNSSFDSSREELLMPPPAEEQSPRTYTIDQVQTLLQMDRERYQKEANSLE